MRSQELVAISETVRGGSSGRISVACGGVALR